MLCGFISEAPKSQANQHCGCWWLDAKKTQISATMISDDDLSPSAYTRCGVAFCVICNDVILMFRVSGHDINFYTVLAILSLIFTEINSSSPGQNGRHFADDIFMCTFLNENIRIWIKFSLKIVLKGLDDNKSAMVQVMACRQTGDNPLPGPMLTQFTDAYMRR